MNWYFKFIGVVKDRDKESIESILIILIGGWIIISLLLITGERSLLSFEVILLVITIYPLLIIIGISLIIKMSNWYFKFIGVKKEGYKRLLKIILGLLIGGWIIISLLLIIWKLDILNSGDTYIGYPEMFLLVITIIPLLIIIGISLIIKIFNWIKNEWEKSK